jgi:hypothetical protein
MCPPATEERRLLRSLCIIATWFWLASAGARARAQDAKTGPARPDNGYWSVGQPRLFVSTRSDLGTPYVKPGLSLGYGMPHWLWTGIDVNGITTTEFLQAYAGLRAATPVFDLAFGVRDSWSYGKPFVAPAARLQRADVLDAPGPKARYWAWELEAVGVLPLPHAGLVADFVVVRTLDVPKGSFVYDESYRAVVKNPLFYVLRVAPVVRVLNEDSLKVGVLTEAVFGTGRAKPVFRVGPAGSLLLTDHLELNVVVTLVVSSPDALGSTLGAYGVAGIRYSWASGEPDPKLPWQGAIIP